MLIHIEILKFNHAISSIMCLINRSKASTWKISSMLANITMKFQALTQSIYNADNKLD